MEDVELLLHHLVEALGSPGLVVDPEKAKGTPCKCYKLPDRDLCFSPGVIGMLTLDQEKEFCVVGKIYKEEGIVERVTKFRQCAAEVQEKIKGIPKGERLRPWLEGMGECLRAKGIEI